MNKEKVYILQEEMLAYMGFIDAGMEFTFNGSCQYINNKSGYFFEKNFVENNPAIFKLKEEEKPYVSDAKYNGHTYIFTLNAQHMDMADISKRISTQKTITVERDRLAEILIAEDKNKLIIEGFPNMSLFVPSEKYYTEKEYIQGLEDAFNSATDKTDNIIGKAKYISGYSENIFEDKYKSFSDYMNWKTIIQPS